MVRMQKEVEGKDVWIESKISDLTWYDFKEVSAWFVWVGAEFVDLTSLQGYEALKHEGISS